VVGGAEGSAAGLVGCGRKGFVQDTKGESGVGADAGDAGGSHQNSQREEQDPCQHPHVDVRLH
jgi:hypothetical protein